MVSNEAHAVKQIAVSRSYPQRSPRISFQIYKIVGWVMLPVAAAFAGTNLETQLPLSGMRVVDHMRDVPYQAISGSEQAFNEFKLASRKDVLQMKVIRAWRADTDANRTACTHERREPSSRQPLCKSLSQQVVIAIEPAGRQPFFVAFVPFAASTRIPIGSLVDVIDGQFKIDQVAYALPALRPASTPENAQ